MVKINEWLNFHMLEYLNKMDDIVDWVQEGQLKSIHLPNIVNVIQAKVYHNPLLRQKRFHTK